MQKSIKEKKKYYVVYNIHRSKMYDSSSTKAAEGETEGPL